MSPTERRLALPGLAVLNAIGPVSFDLYLPAWPALAAHLGCSTGAIALSLSSFLAGHAIGQLFYGPLSDALGRRPFIAFGGLLYLLASLACLWVGDLQTLVALRFVQGLGACAGMVMSRAMIRDSCSVDMAARVQSQLMGIAMLVTLLSPLLGAWLLGGFGWQALFVVLALAGLGMIVIAALLPETWLPERRASWSFRMLRGAYGEVLGHREFLGYALIATSLFAGLFSYLSTAPYLLLQVNHVPPPRFGFYFGVNLIAQAIMFFLNARLVARYGAEAVLRAGLASALLAAGAMAVGAQYGSGWYGGIGLPLIAFLGSMTLIIGNAMALGMQFFPSLAGTAAALSGALQSIIAASLGGTVGLIQNGTAWPLTLSILACSVTALSSYCFVLKRAPWATAY